MLLRTLNNQYPLILYHFLVTHNGAIYQQLVRADRERFDPLRQGLDQTEVIYRVLCRHILTPDALDKLPSG